MDSVITFVAKQDLACSYFPVWVNHDEHLISYNEKVGTGWDLLRFGEARYRDIWVETSVAWSTAPSKIVVVE